MRISKARPQLEALVAQLRSWQTTVPDRARRFHLMRSEYEEKINSALSSWKLWIADEIVQRHRDLVFGLQEVAEPLTGLLRQTEEIETEVQHLEERGAGADAELTAWLESQCRDWKATLARLGSNCYRHSDLHSESALLDKTTRDVRLYDEALDQLREAERILTTLSGDMRTADLTARLPDLRRRLYTQPAIHDWLFEIKGLIKPLKGVAERVQDPPRALSTVRLLLTETRGWSVRLGESHGDVERFEEQQFKAIDWTINQVQTLVDDVSALRDRLRERAAQVRGHKLRELEEQMEDLQRACGHQPELAERLFTLRTMPVERPQMFEDWKFNAERFHESLKNTAYTYAGPLETSLREAASEIEARLAELETRPLSNEVTKEVALLQQELRQLPFAGEIEDVLQRLRRAGEMKRAIEQLGLRAQQDFQHVERSQRELMQRSDSLSAEIDRIKGVTIEVAGVAAEIAALSQSADEASLEHRRKQAEELSIELDELEMEFVEQCRQRLTIRLQAVQRVTEALRRAGAVPAPAEYPVVGSVTSARDAADAVIAAKQLHQSLLQQARAKRKELEGRRVRAQAEIARLRPDELTPGDRHECEQLVRELASGAWSQTSSPLDRLHLLAKLIERHDVFVERLQREQRTALQRRRDLKRRLHLFYEDQLHTYCPELTERVEGLLYGLPERPRQWSAVHHQLGLAEDLFARVDVQARRLAADDVHRASEILRQRVRGTNSPSFRAGAKALLDELDTISPDSLPPVTLRLRLNDASKGWA